MNYGKRQTLLKKDRLRSSTPMYGGKGPISPFRIILCSFLILFSLLFFFVAGAFRGILKSSPDIDDVNIMPSGYATFIYDSQGNQLQKLSSSNSNRMSVSLGKIPLDMQHAIISIEDERFYEHNGVDSKGILRAFIKGAGRGFSFNEGASTLTQQLLKNNVFTNWTSEGKIERFKRKFQEQFLALQLESSLKKSGKNPKSVILENYLNTINLGAGAYGVQAASQRYFAKNVQALTLSEATVLAAIPQNPTRFNPISHPEENSKRRIKILGNMVKQGYITKSQRDQALADNVYDRIRTANYSQTQSAPYSFFIDELIKQVVSDLQIQKGYTEVQAYNALYSGGLRIITSQDPEIQAICDKEYQDPANFPSGSQIGIDWALSIRQANGEIQNYSVEMMKLFFQNSDPDFELLFDTEDEARDCIDRYKSAILKEGDSIIAERLAYSPQPQSSMVILDQATGYVKALVGGRGEKTASLTLNRATDTYRQPGSTFKILSAYAPALDEGLNLSSSYLDEPYEYSDGTPVRNANKSYGGITSIREAIVNSVNVVAVKCITEITPEKGFSYLENFGFGNLVASREIHGKIFTDIQQSLPLGGLTYGVTNLELTAAYGALANKGTYIKPMLYSQILDQKGKVIIDNQAQTSTVTRESTAFMLTKAMEDVVNRGTGTKLQLDDMPVAGKTGTTSAYNDLWFVGYTPYYTCGVWAGYDNNEKLAPDGSYRTFHQTLWKKVMGQIHQNLPSTDFKKPDTVEKMEVCAYSGLLPADGDPTVMEYVDIGHKPRKRCSGNHDRDSIDNHFGQVSSSEQASEQTNTDSIFSYTPSYFYEEEVISDDSDGDYYTEYGP